MRRSLIFPILLFLSFVLTAAEVYSQAELFESKVFLTAEGDSLIYRVMYPAEMEPGTEYTLVLFLHGARERGNDNNAQLKWGVLKFAEEEFRSKHPAIVIAPQADRKSTRLNSSHVAISYAVFCLKKTKPRPS